jgi:small subunit ribosomal protein S3
MGQKVHPIGIRLGVIKRHNANWYASPKNYADFLLTDLAVREYLYKKLKNAAVSRILIERPSETLVLRLVQLVQALSSVKKVKM